MPRQRQSRTRRSRRSQKRHSKRGSRRSKRVSKRSPRRYRSGELCNETHSILLHKHAIKGDVYKRQNGPCKTPATKPCPEDPNGHSISISDLETELKKMPAAIADGKFFHVKDGCTKEITREEYNRIFHFRVQIVHNDDGIQVLIDLVNMPEGITDREYVHKGMSEYLTRNKTFSKEFPNMTFDFQTVYLQMTFTRGNTPSPIELASYTDTTKRKQLLASAYKALVRKANMPDRAMCELFARALLQTVFSEENSALEITPQARPDENIIHFNIKWSPALPAL